MQKKLKKLDGFGKTTIYCLCSEVENMQLERISNKQSNLLFDNNLTNHSSEITIDKMIFIYWFCSKYGEKALNKTLLSSKTIQSFLDLANIIVTKACDSNKISYPLLSEIKFIISSTVISGSIPLALEEEIVQFVGSIEPEIVADYLCFRFSLLLENYATFGQFNTPKSISLLVASLIDLKDDQRVADFCCGTGGFLSHLIDSATSKNIKNVQYCGYDVDFDSIALAKMNMIVRGIENAEINQCDILSSDHGKFDFIFSEFPFGGVYAKTTKELGSDRWSPIHVDRVSRSSFSWVYMAKAINSLKDDGVAICVAPQGALFSTYEADVRKQIIESGFLQSVITLPKLHLPYTGINTTLLIFKKGANDVLFVNTDKYVTSEKRRAFLSKQAIELIANIVRNRSESEISRLVSTDEIRFADYNLLPGRYLINENISSINIPNPKSLEEIKEAVVKSAVSNSEELTSDPTSGIRVVKSSDIENGTFDLEKLDYLKKTPVNVDKYLLNNGDILLTNKSTKIKTAIVNIDESVKLVMFGSLYAIRVNKTLSNPYYIQCFLNSNVGSIELAKLQTGTTIQCITLSNLLSLKVPCPSMEEQNEIAKAYILKLEMLEDAKIRVEKISKDISELFSNLVEE